MRKLIGILDTIDKVSEKTEDGFDDIYSHVYLIGCKRKIRNEQAIIREASLYLKNYLIALNATKENSDKVSDYWF